MRRRRATKMLADGAALDALLLPQAGPDVALKRAYGHYCLLRYTPHSCYRLGGDHMDGDRVHSSPARCWK